MIIFVIYRQYLIVYVQDEAGIKYLIIGVDRPTLEDIFDFIQLVGNGHIFEDKCVKDLVVT